MKITLYIRKGRAGRCTMHTRTEDEPNYDTPRILNLGRDIRDTLDRIIAECDCASDKKGNNK